MASFVDGAAFSVQPHVQHPRLRQIVLHRKVLDAFFEQAASIDVQNLEYVPFMRFRLARLLANAAGPGFSDALNHLVRDRESGGFTLGVQGSTQRADDFVKFGTAVGHLLGPGNHDAMSGTYYARFIVKHTDTSDSYLRQAYRLFTLHTDGTFVSEATDWLLMMKFEELNAVGGESRLLHLDDWEERDCFVNDPLGARPLLYKAPGSKNVAEEVLRPVFFHGPHGLSMSFIDQFVQPRTIEEAGYLHDLSASMESSPATRDVTLPCGDLVVLNNHFWLHGRAPFRPNPLLHRELMRQRGMLA